MTKSLLLVFALFMTSCTPKNLIDTVWIDNNNQSPFFQIDQTVYITELDTSAITFVGSQGPINDSSISAELQKILDGFDLETNDNFGYKSAKEFFAIEYNMLFKRGVSRSGAKTLKVASVNWNNLNDNKFRLEVKKTPKNGVSVKVVVPENLDKFCSDFARKYPNADYVILTPYMLVSEKPLTKDVYFNSQSLVRLIGAILVPKTIIDVKNSKILLFNLDQLALTGSPLLDKRVSMKMWFELEGTYINAEY